MAHPHKGPRRGFQLRWTEEQRRLVQTRAEAVGLTMNDYLLELVRRDEVDDAGRPTWAPVQSHSDQPALELTA